MDTVTDKNGNRIGFTTPELQANALAKKLVAACKDSTLHVALLAMTKAESMLRFNAVVK